MIGKTGIVVEDWHCRGGIVMEDWHCLGRLALSWWHCRGRLALLWKTGIVVATQPHSWHCLLFSKLVFHAQLTCVVKSRGLASWDQCKGWLAWCQTAVCGCGRNFDRKLVSQCSSTYKCLSTLVPARHFLYMAGTLNPPKQPVNYSVHSPCPC